MNIQKISTFIKSTANYLQNSSFTSGSVDNILDELLLSDAIDLTDENSIWLSNFFHSLYWLLQSFTEFNHTARKSVEVLIKLSSKENVRQRLVANVFFIPLCNLLSDGLPKEDKYKLLKLLDQLSVEIELTFLPENIHKTLDMLSMWAVNQNDLIAASSLQILSNICYRNDNVKFALSNSTHIKELYRHCLNEMNNSIYANKLLIILKTSDYHFPLIILKLLTYEIIFEHVRNGDVRALRDKINIFFDIRSCADDGFNSLNSEDFDFENKFIKYLEDAPRDTVTGAQLASETLRFLRLLISHNVPLLLEPNVAIRIAKVALNWCCIDNAVLIYNMDCAQIQSILLLFAVVDNSNKIKKNGNSVLKEIASNWTILQELLLSVLKHSATIENTSLHLALVRLMRACVRKDSLREYVVKVYESFDMSYVFNMSSSQQNSSKLVINLKDIFFDNNDMCKTVNDRLLLLYTVALLVEICQFENKCYETVKQMLTNTEIQTVLSQILLSKNDEEGAEVKATVLSVLQCGHFPIAEFSHVLTQTPVTNFKIEPIKQIHYPQINVAASTSSSLLDRFYVVTGKLEEKLHIGEIDDSAADIISLYSLRIAQMESRAILDKENLSVQSKTLAQIQQENERFNIEINRMSRQSVMRAKSFHVIKKENVEWKDKIDGHEKTIHSMKDQQLLINDKFNDSLRQIGQLREENKQKEGEKEHLKRKYDEEIKKYQYKLKKQEKESSKLTKDNDDLNETIVKLKQANEEVQTSLQQAVEELNKKNILLVQRQKDLIEIKKEKEALSNKIDILQSSFQNFQKLF